MDPFKLGKDRWARTRPTKEGIIFLALTLFVGFAALNTGNNLLYLVFGMMLSFIAASGIMSTINLSGVEVKAITPEDAFALTSIPFKLSVKNSKSLIPSYSLTIDIEGKSAFIPYLPPKSTKNVTINSFFKKRGWNKIPKAILFTRFPFGFFKKWIRIDQSDEEILVYPKVEKPHLELDEFQEKFGELQSEATGFGSDLRSIRTYNEGDNPKFIHWKTTAKTGTLMYRELQDDKSKRYIIEFNPTKDENHLELEITHAASVLLELLKHDYEVEFVAPDRTFTPSQIGRFPRPVLRYLALYN